MFRTSICSLLLLTTLSTSAQHTFENAKTAVANMRIGWNAGNRLDSNSGDVNNMWIEAWTERKPENYETAWGQPVITRELIHMFKVWMTVADGDDCKVPKWSNVSLKDAMVKGYTTERLAITPSPQYRTIVPTQTRNFIISTERNFCALHPTAYIKKR